MKKITKLVSLLLALCLIFTAVPFVGSAASVLTYDFNTMYRTMRAAGYVDADGDWGISEHKADTDALYASDSSLKLKPETYTYGFSGKHTNSDIRTYTGADTYIAFRMRKSSSDTGTYSVSFKHDVSARGGIVALHILPADTTDIQGALDASNRVGRIDFNGGNGNTNPADPINVGKTDTLGNWTFGNETEFIVVFNCVENSPYFSNQCYMFLEQLTFTPGAVSVDQITTSDRVDPIVISENAIEYFETVVYGAVGEVDGHDYLYLPIEGDRMLVYDLETREKIDSVVTPFDVCRGITVDDDGIVWMVGSAPCVFKYDPFTGATTQYESYKPLCDNVANSGFYLYNTDDHLYFGTSESAHILRFTKATGAYKVYGSVANPYSTSAAYTCGVAVDAQEKYLYCGFAGDKQKTGTEVYEILKIDLATGKEVARVDFSNLFAKSEVMFRGMGLSSDGKTLFAAASGCQGIACVDTETMTPFIPTDAQGKPAYNKINYDVTKDPETGITYLCLGSTGMDYATGTAYPYGDTEHLLATGLYTWNEDAKCLEYVSSFNKALKCGQSSFATIGGNDCIVFYDTDGVGYYDLTQDRIIRLEGMVNEETDGAPISLQPLSTDRNGNLYMGTFNTSKCRIYDVEQENLTDAFFTNGQTDALLWYEHNGEYALYAGNYNTGRLTKVDLTDPTGASNEYLVGLKHYDNMDKELSAEELARAYDLHQSRVHTITAGDGKVFIGSIPDQYEYGGCIAWYDLDTGKTFATRGADTDGDGMGNGVIENQSIIKLVYKDGYLYGITSISGGTGAAEQKVSEIQAKLFVYDVAADTVVYQSTLQSELAAKGYTLANQKALTSLELDPSGEKLWCIAGDYLFDFTFNKNTNAITIGQIASFKGNTSNTDTVYSGFRAREIVFDADYLYAGANATSGFCRISRSDITQSEQLPVELATFYAIGGDGNLYYTRYEKLYMYSLTSTDDDRTAAKAVDSQIAALGTITIEKEGNVLAAQAAYDALDMESKSLVKNLYLLEEAHIDLLEAEIDAIGAVTADKAERIKALMAQYKALSAQDRALVKNYSTLKNAYDTAFDAAYQVGEVLFADIEKAISAAVSNPVGARTVVLQKSVTVGELMLRGGVTLDLNGFTLETSAFTAAIAPDADGYIVDSSTGNEGLLKMSRDGVFHENNPDLPLYDPDDAGYRFFDYDLYLHSTTDKVATGRQKFWFKFHFYTDDACTELDQDAYDLVKAGNSDFTVSANLTWQGAALTTVYFGNNGDVDAFSRAWATGANEGRWLYVIVSGLAGVDMKGTLTVEPVLEANGVKASNGVIAYEKKGGVDYGWSEDIIIPGT